MLRSVFGRTPPGRPGRGESTFNLGRIFGIRIGLNWTWLIVFALVVWSLATFLCPAQSPGLSTTTYWAMAAVASTLFIVSIRLHELGHALQARRDGVPIEGITLWLFGGVAKFKGMYPSARVEFRIAIAGPIVSAVVAATLLAGAILAAMPAALGGVWDARHTTYAVVENGGRVAGLLPFRCVAEIPRREWDERRVRDCMVPRERVRSCAARCA